MQQLTSPLTSSKEADFLDNNHRIINYLRLSVTDRCNLRCIYCMPEEGVKFVPHGEILTYEEMLRVVSLCVLHGIRKVRLTGGEPLVRKGIIPFIEGFSCLVRGFEKTILFDTGGDGYTLLGNMRQLGIKPANVHVIILSHIHGDHTGGIKRLIEEKSNVDVYLPTSFPGSFEEMPTSLGAQVKEVSGVKEILTGVYTTGELGNGLKEQSLVLITYKGLVVITGCAHPGIVNTIRKAKEITGENKVYLVIGGFHLAGESASRLKSILKEFRRLSVQKVAPCHCTGDGARRLFKQEYGADYIECGVGKRITLP